MIIISCHNLAISRMARLHGRLHRTNIRVHIVGGAFLHHTTSGTNCRNLSRAFANPATITFNSRSTATPTHVFSGFTRSRRTLAVGNNVVSKRIIALSRVRTLTGLPGHRNVLSVLYSILRTPIHGFTCTIGTITSDGSRDTTWSTLDHVNFWAWRVGWVKKFWGNLECEGSRY